MTLKPPRARHELPAVGAVTTPFEETTFHSGVHVRPPPYALGAAAASGSLATLGAIAIGLGLYFSLSSLFPGFF